MQWVVVNTKPQNWSKCRDSVIVEWSDPNETFVSLSFARAQGSSRMMGMKDCKSKSKTATLNMTELFHINTQQLWLPVKSLHKIKPFQHGWRHSWIHTPNWRAMDSWCLMLEGESGFFLRMWLLVGLPANGLTSRSIWAERTRAVGILS